MRESVVHESYKTLRHAVNISEENKIHTGNLRQFYGEQTHAALVSFCSSDYAYYHSNGHHCH